MRKFILTVMASLLSCSAAHAFWPEAADSLLEIGVGYRQDSFEWKTSNHNHHSSSGNDCESYGNDTYGTYEEDTCVGVPFRTRSKVRWHDLQIWQIEARAKYVTCDNIYVRAYGDYGWVTSGRNRIRDRLDFGSDSLSFSDSDCDSGSGQDCRHSSTNGNVYDAKIAIGYQFKWCEDSLAIAPLVGYSWHGQRFRDRHRQRYMGWVEEVETVEDSSDLLTGSRSSYYSYDSGSFDNYGSCSSSSEGRDRNRYHARWNGPFVGFDFDYRFGCGCDWSFFGGYEFHWARFHARTRGELRPDFCNGCRHRSNNAYGNYFDLGIRWEFCDCWTASIIGQFQCWYARRGRERALIAEGEICDIKTDCHVRIPIRDIQWWSGSVSLNIGMVF